MLEIGIRKVDFEAVVQKMRRRLDTLPSHPLHLANEDGLAETFWKNVQASLVETIEANRSHQRAIFDVAMVFGDPLNDTVFMLMPVKDLSRWEVKRQLAVPGLDGPHMIDFYARIKATY